MPTLTSVGEADGGDDDRAEGRADHRDDVEERDDGGQRDGVLAEPDDEQEDQREMPAHIATTKAPET